MYMYSSASSLIMAKIIWLGQDKKKLAIFHLVIALPRLHNLLLADNCHVLELFSTPLYLHLYVIVLKVFKHDN